MARFDDYSSRIAKALDVQQTRLQQKHDYAANIARIQQEPEWAKLKYENSPLAQERKLGLINAQNEPQMMMSKYHTDPKRFHEQWWMQELKDTPEKQKVAYLTDPARFDEQWWLQDLKNSPDMYKFQTERRYVDELTNQREALANRNPLTNPVNAKTGASFTDINPGVARPYDPSGLGGMDIGSTGTSYSDMQKAKDKRLNDDVESWRSGGFRLF